MDPFETESETEAFGEAFSGEAEPTVIQIKPPADVMDTPDNESTETDIPDVLESNTEITVVTIGKETPNQAFFIQEKHLDSTLEFIRNTALPSQGLSLPSHFKFMSSGNKNIIPVSIEKKITLKKLINNDGKDSVQSAENENDDRFITAFDLPQNSCQFKTDSKSNLSTTAPRLFICSMRSKKKRRKTNDREEPPNETEDIGSEGTNEGEIDEMSRTQARDPTHQFDVLPNRRCPMHNLNRMLFNAQNGAGPLSGPCPIQMPNTKVLIKAFIGCTCALISMVLLLLMTFYSLACIINWPGPEVDGVMNMRMKLSELEMAHRYDTQDMRSRLGELEENAEHLHVDVDQMSRRTLTKFAALEKRLDLLESSTSGPTVNAAARDAGAGEQPAKLDVPASIRAAPKDSINRKPEARTQNVKEDAKVDSKNNKKPEMVKAEK